MRAPRQPFFSRRQDGFARSDGYGRGVTRPRALLLALLAGCGAPEEQLPPAERDALTAFPARLELGPAPLGRTLAGRVLLRNRGARPIEVSIAPAGLPPWVDAAIEPAA